MLIENFFDLKERVIFGLQNLDLLKTIKYGVVIKPVAGGRAPRLINEAGEGIIVNGLPRKAGVLHDFADLVELFSFHVTSQSWAHDLGSVSRDEGPQDPREREGGAF